MRISDWSSDVCSSDLVAYLKDVKIAGPLSVWGSVGLATGYRRHDVLPIALIGPKLDVGQRAALRVGYAPKLGEVNDTHLVHFALELKRTDKLRVGSDGVRTCGFGCRPWL